MNIIRVILWPLAPTFWWLEKRQLAKIIEEIDDEPPFDLDPFGDEFHEL